MGSLGGQSNIGSIKKLSPMIGGAYLNNVVVSCQQNNIDDTEVAAPFTVYLSNSPVGDWLDSQVISAKATSVGGGTVSLSAKRYIRTNADGVTEDEGSFGPVYIWAEVADTSSTTDETRFTIEAWGRMVILEGNFD